MRDQLNPEQTFGQEKSFVEKLVDQVAAAIIEQGESKSASNFNTAGAQPETFAMKIGFATK